MNCLVQPRVISTVHALGATASDMLDPTRRRMHLRLAPRISVASPPAMKRRSDFYDAALTRLQHHLLASLTDSRSF
jgi:hypothetical protein